ncbi:hypothetical protein T492DRAFT_831770 [Pavlovales sp. CCMP2436]|nr:hypothetical protein T492DRAFT_831770 [Pavlovales sp. CCMP2436]
MFHRTPVSPFLTPLRERSIPIGVNHISGGLAELLFAETHPPPKSETYVPACRPIAESMKVETMTDQSWLVSFEGMARYTSVEIDCDSLKGTLTVSGKDVSANHSTTVSHAISLPCVVVKPELLSAETHHDSVVVHIPREAADKRWIVVPKPGLSVKELAEKL